MLIVPQEEAAFSPWWRLQSYSSGVICVFHLAEKQFPSRDRTGALKPGPFKFASVSISPPVAGWFG